MAFFSIFIQHNEITEEELDNVILSIDRELSVQKANIALNNCESYIMDQNRLPRFQYQQLQSGKKSKPLPFSPDTPESSLNVENMREIEEEIQSLRQLVNNLETDMEAKQEQFKAEMQSLSSRFENVVCIPPMARKSYNV